MVKILKFSLKWHNFKNSDIALIIYVSITFSETIGDTCSIKCEKNVKIKKEKRKTFA